MIIEEKGDDTEMQKISTRRMLKNELSGRESSVLIVVHNFWILGIQIILPYL